VASPTGGESICHKSVFDNTCLKVQLPAYFVPQHDLALLCALSEYPNTEIAKAATTAFAHHLWYLCEILIAFAFFDDDVTTQEKCLMVVALQEVKG